MGGKVRSQLFGVLGDPIGHSLSPAMHNAAFAAAGLPHLYLRYQVAPVGLAAALGEARRLGMGGLNLTVPLKETVLPLLDEMSPEAERAGAVNTVVFRRGRLVGENTDGRGFLRSLAGQARVRGGVAVLIGAGGSARAVGAALVAAGCRQVTIANRTVARAASLAARLAETGGVATRATGLDALADGDVLGGATLVVNTTPLGLAGAGLRIRYAASPPGCLFVDLVYGRRPTTFLRAAHRAGRRTLDGAGMLLHQGALAFEVWTGRRAPLGAMARALTTAGLRLTPPKGAPSVRGSRPAAS